MALQPLSPASYHDATPADIAANPKRSFLLPSARTAPVSRRDENSLHSQLTSVSELIESAYRSGLRGDVDKANRRVTDIETFIDNNADMLEAFANSKARSEDSLKLRELAASLLTGDYLRQVTSINDGKQQIDVSLSSLLSDENPFAATFQHNKQMRSLGDSGLEALATGSNPDLPALSALYKQTIGATVGKDGISVVASAPDMDVQQLFSTILRKRENGELDDIDDNSLAQITQGAIGKYARDPVTKQPVRSRSLAQMVDAFENIICMAGGDYSPASLSQAVTEYDAADRRLTGPAENPDPQTSQDLLSAGRLLWQAGAINDEGGPIAMQDFLTPISTDEDLVRDYATLRASGFFDGMSQLERQATLMSLDAIHLSRRFGGNVGGIDKYTDNEPAKRIKSFLDVASTLDSVADKVTLGVAQALNSTGDAKLDAKRAEADFLSDQTIYQAKLSAPVSTMVSALKMYAAEASNKDPDNYVTLDQSLTSLATDADAPRVVASALQASYKMDPKTANVLATGFLKHIAADSADFDLEKFYTAVTTVPLGAAEKQALNDASRLSAINTKMSQGVPLTPTELTDKASLLDKSFGLNSDELTQYLLDASDDQSFSTLGSTVQTAYHDFRRRFIGDTSSIHRAIQKELSSQNADALYKGLTAKLSQITETVAKGEIDEAGEAAQIDALYNQLLAGKDEFNILFPTPATSSVDDTKKPETLSSVLQSLSSSPAYSSLAKAAVFDMLAKLQAGKDMQTAAGPMFDLLYTLHSEASADVTDPSARELLKTATEASARREAAQIRFMLDKGASSNDFAPDLNNDRIAELRSDVDNGLRDALDFISGDHLRVNASTMTTSARDPSQLLTVQNALTQMMSSDVKATRDSAQKALYALTALQSGEAAAQHAIDTMAPILHGRGLFDEMNRITEETNKKLKGAANDIRTATSVANYAEMSASVLTAGGLWVASKGIANAALAKGVTSTALSGSLLLATPNTKPQVDKFNSGVASTDDYRDMLWARVGVSHQDLPMALQLTSDTPWESAYSIGEGLAFTGSVAITGGVSAAAFSGATSGAAAGAGIFSWAGAAIGAGIAALSVLTVNLVAAMKEGDITDEYYGKLSDALRGVANSIENDPHISNECKTSLSGVQSALDDTSLDQEERFKKAFNELQSFMVTMKRQYEADANNAAKDLRARYSASNQDAIEQRKRLEAKAAGLLYSEASHGGLCSSTAEAARVRSTLSRMSSPAVSRLYQRDINDFVATAMSYIGKDSNGIYKDYLTSWAQAQGREYFSAQQKASTGDLPATFKQALKKAAFDTLDAEGYSFLDRFAANARANITANAEASSAASAKSKAEAAMMTNTQRTKQKQLDTALSSYKDWLKHISAEEARSKLKEAYPGLWPELAPLIEELSDGAEDTDDDVES